MIKSENTEKHKELRQLFNKETGVYAIKDNESYMNWLENIVVKNCSIPDVSCCALLEELQLKLIAMSCFAQEHYNEKAYDFTKMNIDEIRDWIKKKRLQHCS